MDYRELLKKYMDHVAIEEGTTFVGPGMSTSWERLSVEEQAELFMIENELSNQNARADWETGR